MNQQMRQGQSVWMHLGVAASAILLGTSAVLAGPPAIEDIVERSLLGDAEFLDKSLGNGWERTDLFTNTSEDWSVTVTSVVFFVADPDAVGFDDIFGSPSSPPTNLPDVLAAAEAANPAFGFWGANWWLFADSQEVDWQSTEILSPVFPAVIGPGESLQLTTRSHNSVFGDSLEGVSNYGEMVIGFQVNGFVTVPGASCAEDLTGDSIVSVADLVALILQWGDCPDPPAECSGDFNDDGFVRVADLVAMILAWGACQP